MSICRTQVICAVVAMAVAGSGAAFMMTGCEGLDYSARGEGTGIQIVGAIVVLAKYHASNRQKAAAEAQARAAVARMAKPVYERRRMELQADARKNVANLEDKYKKRLAQAQRAKETTGDAGAGAAAEIEAEKARLEKARAELTSLERASWESQAAHSNAGLKMEAEPAASGGVPLASTRDPEALFASASAHLPKYLAVEVQREGVPAEQGGQSVVMFWDTRRQRLVDNDVRVLNRTIRDGVDGKVDGVNARFVSR